MSKARELTCQSDPRFLLLFVFFFFKKRKAKGWMADSFSTLSSSLFLFNPQNIDAYGIVGAGHWNCFFLLLFLLYSIERRIKKKKQEKEIAERATRESKKIFAGRWARVGSGSWWGKSYTKPMTPSWSERTISHTGTETRPGHLRVAAVGNLGQWAKAWPSHIAWVKKADWS